MRRPSWARRPARRRVRRGWLALIATAVAFLWSAAPASAHPLGNFTVNLYAGIRLFPGEVRVDHVIDMAEIPTVQVFPEIDANADGSLSAVELARWASSPAAEVASNLTLTVDGEPVALQVVSTSARLRPGQAGLGILRIESTFAGPISAAGELRFRDGNLADRVGWREITAAGTNGSAVARSNVPARSVTDRLLTYPRDLLSSPLDVREAVVSFGSGIGVQIEREASSRSVERPGLASEAFTDLVDTRGPWMLLAPLLAFGFGALHALGPGHGKTLMAAYLVGAGARTRQVAAVGGAVAVMHTASVLALGSLVLTATEMFAPERVYPWLGLGSGLIALSLGIGSLVVRLAAWRHRGARDAGNVETDGRALDHRHGQTHHHVVPEVVLSRRGLAAIALAGGLLPSPTALVVLLASLAVGRAAYGLGLIAAFSVGLATALFVVGIVALRAGDAVSRRLSSRFARVLPVLSASAIAVVGLALAARAFAQI